MAEDAIMTVVRQGDDYLTVQDVRKVAIFLCPCCDGNRIVELIDWPTGLSEVFGGVDFSGESKTIWTLLSVPDGKVGEMVSDCMSWTEVDARFGRVMTLVGNIFGIKASCPYFVEDDDIGEGEECDGVKVVEAGRGESGERVEESVCCFGHKECVPVFLYSEVDVMVKVRRFLGMIDREGEFVCVDDDDDDDDDDDAVELTDGVFV